MAFNIKEFLLSTLTGTLETVGESKLLEVLQDLHDSNLPDYKAAMAGAYALTTHLMPVVLKSKSPIDDAILKAISEAIEASAAANSINLKTLANAPVNDAVQ